MIRDLAIALIAFSGIAGCVYLAMHGHPVIAVIVFIGAGMIVEDLR